MSFKLTIEFATLAELATFVSAQAATVDAPLPHTEARPTRSRARSNAPTATQAQPETGSDASPSPTDEATTGAATDAATSPQPSEPDSAPSGEPRDANGETARYVAVKKLVLAVSNDERIGDPNARRDAFLSLFRLAGVPNLKSVKDKPDGELNAILDIIEPAAKKVLADLDAAASAADEV